jgi:hypothetical protein
LELLDEAVEELLDEAVEELLDEAVEAGASHLYHVL